MIIIATTGHSHIRVCLESLGQTNHSVVIQRSGQYDFGKYCALDWGEDVLCMHDSAWITDPEFIRRGFDLLQVVDIAAPYTFAPNHYDSEAQREWVRSECGSDDYDVGVFGPIFFARWTVMGRLIEEAPVLYSKMHQQAMERGLGVFAKRFGWKIHSMGGDVTHSFAPVLEGRAGLSKVFPQRN